jgi:hypothetical protein
MTAIVNRHRNENQTIGIYYGQHFPVTLEIRSAHQFPLLLKTEYETELREHIPEC